MDPVRIGIIGGSGLYRMPGVEEAEERPVETPFGSPSDSLLIGTLAGRRVAFLPRHGRSHAILPSEMNVRANIYAFKTLGVERIVAAGAVGSMRETIRPMDVVIPDQLLDRTKGRSSTFFGDGVVAHVAFAEPFCSELRPLLAAAARAAGARTHAGGTYLCIEGPAFSTRAESLLYRSWGVDVIGMTALQEAKLSREAEICYGAVGLVTDYDCWHETEEGVSVEAILEVLERNADRAAVLVADAVRTMPVERGCACGEALKGAIITRPEAIPAATRKRLAAILDRHLGKPRA